MPVDPRAVLARYPDACRPVGPIVALGGAGGRSGSQWWRFPTLGGTLGLRAWPPAPIGPDTDRLAMIHAWLSAALTLPFVPRPLPGRDGRTWQCLGGRLWELLPWLDGEAEPHPAERPTRIASGFRALARFHQTMTRSGVAWGTSPNVQSRREELERLLSGRFETLSRSVETGGDVGLLVTRWRLLAERLAPRCVAALRAVAGVSVRLQPCIRDMRGAHLLFDGDTVSGLVDYGAMGVDSVATDLARLSEDWLGADSVFTGTGLAGYETIRPLDASERRLIAPLAQSGMLLAGANWIQWGAVERREGIPETLWVEGLSRSLERLARWASKS